MSVDYEYVTIDVDIMTHPKAIAAGIEAMGLWLWAMAWSHKTGANGRIPRHVISMAWGGPPKLVVKLGQRLVTSGLWAATDEGWSIWNYGKKNQSAEEKERKRALGRERMRRLRDGRRDADGDADCDASLVRHVRDEYAAPASATDLVQSRSPEPDPARTTPHNDAPPLAAPVSLVQIPDAMSDPPDWWEAVLGTLHASTGVLLPARPAWISYAGHRHDKRKPASRNDALYWLNQVKVPEAKREAAEARRTQDRDAKFDAERVALRTPQPAPYHASAGKKRTPRPPEPTDAERAEAQKLALAALGTGTMFAMRTPTGTDE